MVSEELPRLEPLRHVRTDTLEVAYFEAGPEDGEVALLLHGFPYDIHSYVDVIPQLTEAGHRVIVPSSTRSRARTPHAPSSAERRPQPSSGVAGGIRRSGPGEASTK